MKHQRPAEQALWSSYFYLVQIALAQIHSGSGDVTCNTARHLRCIQAAAGADLVVFPELSLTGYAPELAAELAMLPSDPRLGAIQETVDETGVRAAVGLPIASDPLPHIGVLVFQPKAPVWHYAKRHVHADEQPYFSPGTFRATQSIGSGEYVWGICYESLLEEHLSEFLHTKISGYLAPVAKPVNGVSLTHAAFPRIAKRWKVPVFMVNAVGPCSDFVNAGGSAFWSSDGTVLGQLSADREEMLVVDLDSEKARRIELSF